MKQMKCVVTLICCVMLAGTFLTACGESADYSEVIDVNERYIGLLEAYVNNLESAGSAADVAGALNELADGLESVIPEMKSLMGKYPELKNADQQPERVRALTQKAAEVAKKFAGSMPKIMPYMNDPDVQQAQQRIGAVWQNS